MKFHFICRDCGALLLKVLKLPGSSLTLYDSEVKCQKCGKVVKLPDEANMIPEVRQSTTG